MTASTVEKIAARLTGEFYVGQPVKFWTTLLPITGTVHQVVSKNHLVILSGQTGNYLDAVAANVEPL